MKRAIVSVFLLAIVLMPQGCAQITEVNDPATMPLLSDFEVPQIEPGESGELSFYIWNRYDERMENVSIEVEVYEYATIKLSRDISKVSPPPIIQESGSTSYSESVASIQPRRSLHVSVVIKTKGSTPEGNYFVRLWLTFTYRNESVSMKSRGHFSDELWEEATVDPTMLPWGINMSLLNVSTIIPETSFAVKTPIPLWPMIVLIALATFIGTLAVLFYLQETSGRFPWVEVRYQRYRGMLLGIRYRLERRVERAKELMEERQRAKGGK